MAVSCEHGHEHSRKRFFPEEAFIIDTMLLGENIIVRSYAKTDLRPFACVNTSSESHILFPVQYSVWFIVMHSRVL